MKKRNLLLLTVVAAALILLLPGTALANPSGTTYYVNDDATGVNNGTNWTDAFTDLQSALNKAVTGDEIWVAAGTYQPSVTIDDSSDPRTAAFILKSGVKIYGGFAGDEKDLTKRSSDPALTHPRRVAVKKYCVSLRFTN